MSQRWRAVGNTVSDLTGPRFEPQTSHLPRAVGNRDKRATARPTGRFWPGNLIIANVILAIKSFQIALQAYKIKSKWRYNGYFFEKSQKPRRLNPHYFRSLEA